MIRFLSWCLAKGIDLASWVLEDTGTGRSEDHHPDLADEIRTCRVNATPHRCTGDQHVFPKRPPDYPTTPRERRFADDVEDFLRSHHGA